LIGIFDRRSNGFVSYDDFHWIWIAAFVCLSKCILVRYSFDHTSDAPGAIGPYVQTRVIGNTLCISGVWPSIRTVGQIQLILVDMADFQTIDGIHA
jgi:hypothetical protein